MKYIVAIAFVLCCLSIMLAATTYYIVISPLSSPEAKDFLSEFAPNNLLKKPLSPKGFVDDILFLLELAKP